MNRGVRFKGIHLVVRSSPDLNIEIFVNCEGLATRGAQVLLPTHHVLLEEDLVEIRLVSDNVCALISCSENARSSRSGGVIPAASHSRSCVSRVIFIAYAVFGCQDAPRSIDPMLSFQASCGLVQPRDSDGGWHLTYVHLVLAHPGEPRRC